MSCYLYPNLPSKVAYKRAIEEGREVLAKRNTPWGQILVEDDTVTFEGPHFPQPHRYYGRAVVKNGKVVKVT
jgi:hypothetical protein